MDRTSQYSYYNPNLEQDVSELCNMQNFPINEDVMDGSKSQKGCMCKWASRLVAVGGYILAAVIVFVFLVLYIPKVQQQTDNPCPNTAKQIFEDLKNNGLVFFVDSEETVCKEPYCQQCTTDVLLKPPQAAETLDCSSTFNLTGCRNCSELLLATAAESNSVECNGRYAARHLKCLTVLACSEEDWCQGGTLVYDNKAGQHFCNCPVGRNGSNCQDTYTAQFQCDCYSSVFKLSPWSSIEPCGLESFSEPPNKCRLNVTETGGGYKQCVCKNYEQATDKPECTVVKEEM